MIEPFELNVELDVLRTLTIGMFDLVSEQLEDALRSILTNDQDLAMNVRKLDDLVDSMEMKIDSQCEKILASGQLLGTDVRQIIATLKANTELERIGDHSKNLAKDVILNGHIQNGPVREHIRIMGDAACAVLHATQQAFTEKDTTLAHQLIAEDKRVNRLHRQTVTAFIENHWQGHDATAIALFIGMSKALERVADHAVNIAEDVIFWIEGMDVRHRNLQRSAAYKGDAK